MRHRRRVKHFDRTSGPRKALLRGLCGSLIEHGRITTTVDRAKETKRHIERLITIAKRTVQADTDKKLAGIRLLMTKLPNPILVKQLVEVRAKSFTDRNGGYTRVIKIGRRPGDTAEMAFLEFVDHKWEKEEDKQSKSTKTAKPKKVKFKTKTEEVAAKA